MAQEHLAHHLDYRKYLINGSKCYYDIMMLLSSGSICQAPNFKSFSEEVSKCLQATVRANKQLEWKQSIEMKRREPRAGDAGHKGRLLFILSAKS